jgi:hypothetical protein
MRLPDCLGGVRLEPNVLKNASRSCARAAGIGLLDDMHKEEEERVRTKEEKNIKVTSASKPRHISRQTVFGPCAS